METEFSLSRQFQQDRGDLVARFIEETVQPLSGLNMLELGCGQGEISGALSAAHVRLTATDLSISALKRARDRLRSAPKPAPLCVSSALDLPFPTAQFECVLLNGVLEWVGKAAPERNPEACQLQVLKEIYRVLGKGGWLYLAIDNRYYPLWIVHDPHVKSPLVAVLPRRVANAVHRWFTGSTYITYLHSSRKLQSLLRDAGFGEIEFYVPLFHYRWPLKVVPARDGRSIAREIVTLRRELRNRNGSSWASELKFALYRYTALLGLSRFLFSSFVVLARRPSSA